LKNDQDKDTESQLNLLQFLEANYHKRRLDLQALDLIETNEQRITCNSSCVTKYTAHIRRCHYYVNLRKRTPIATQQSNVQYFSAHIGKYETVLTVMIYELS
jgi:hypothetical protein